jgi:ribosomal protein S18 acetylase RimI-like enzyme
MIGTVRIAPLGRADDADPALREALLELERTTQDRPLGWEALTREVGPTVATPGVLLVANVAAVLQPDRSGFVGFASAQLLVDDAHVLRLAVVPDARRQGVGRQLLDGLVGWAVEVGAAAVVLEVRAGNVAARTLYAAAGFVEDGLRRGYYPDGEDAALLRHTPGRRDG